jgi:hypothetical protein
MLVALSGKGRALTHQEYNQLLDDIGYRPRIEELQADSEAAAAQKQN